MSRQHLISTVLASIVLASGTVAASGSIYKWVDQNGMTQYTQTPPPKNAKSSQTVRVSTHVPVDVREGRPQGMVDAATLQAYTSPAQANGQPSSPAQALVNAREATIYDTPEPTNLPQTGAPSLPISEPESPSNNSRSNNAGVSLGQ